MMFGFECEFFLLFFLDRGNLLIDVHESVNIYLVMIEGPNFSRLEAATIYLCIRFFFWFFFLDIFLSFSSSFLLYIYIKGGFQAHLPNQLDLFIFDPRIEPLENLNPILHRLSMPQHITPHQCLHGPPKSRGGKIARDALPWPGAKRTTVPKHLRRGFQPALGEEFIRPRENLAIVVEAVCGQADTGARWDVWKVLHLEAAGGHDACKSRGVRHG